MAKNISKYLPLRLINEFDGIGCWRYDDVKEKCRKFIKPKSQMIKVYLFPI